MILYQMNCNAIDSLFQSEEWNEEMTLPYYAIPDIVVTNSIVRHLASQTIKKE